MIVVTLSDLLAALGNVGLTLRRGEGDSIEVVGDTATLTTEIKSALATHKAGLLELLPEPKPRLAWWSRNLSDRDNEAVDEFMGYGPDGQIEGEGLALADVAPCGRCGSPLAWFDCLGNQHCRRCDPPTRSVRTGEKAERLRQTATERMADDSIPMHSRYRSRRKRRVS